MAAATAPGRPLPRPAGRDMMPCRMMAATTTTGEEEAAKAQEEEEGRSSDASRRGVLAVRRPSEEELDSTV